MTADLTCEVTYQAVSTHVQHLLTGFHALARAGTVRMTQRITGEPLCASSDVRDRRVVAGSQIGVRLIAPGCRSLALHFDNHDGAAINGAALETCDLYFKRSFSREFITRHHPDEHGKIRPLGLYFPVYPDSFDRLALERNLHFATGWRSRARGAALAVGWRRPQNYLPTINEIEALPDYRHAAKVLFLAAAYDPDDDDRRPEAMARERHDNNEFRAAVIRGLRAELGSRFLGGFAGTRFTREHYGDIALEDDSLTRRTNYVRILRSYGIGVATTGLHGSIGAKFAEYVAASKAILSEPLRFGVPGDLSPSTNYLEFRTPDECVAAASRLLSDRELRLHLMENNARYYRRFARPDVLVLNALLDAIRLWR